MAITIGSFELPLYGLFFFIGIGVAATVGVFLMKKRKIDGFDFTCAAVYTMIGAMIGAKLLYVLVTLRPIIILMRAGVIGIMDIVKGGFVFYGGLLGGAFGLWVYGKQFKMDMRDFFDLFATILPLGHAFGRVGCYFAGCCYGMEYHGFLSLPSWDARTNAWGVNRLPVQLLEASALLILFGVLLYLYLKKDKVGLNASVYGLVYAGWRFFIEFFRGDKERGVFLISTSQWISLGIIAFIVTLYLIKRYRKKKHPKEELPQEEIKE